jgi:CheY-like chemotaxis protein
MRSLGGVRVLVVDDEHDTLEMFDGILAVAGAEVRRATGATPAIEMLETWRPDVILSDIEMPLENGYAFIRRLRSLSPEAAARCRPAVTARGASSTASACSRPGSRCTCPSPWSRPSWSPPSPRWWRPPAATRPAPDPVGLYTVARSQASSQS